MYLGFQWPVKLVAIQWLGMKNVKPKSLRQVACVRGRGLARGLWNAAIFIELLLLAGNWFYQLLKRSGPSAPMGQR